MKENLTNEFRQDFRMDAFNSGKFGWLKTLLYSTSIRVCAVYRLQKGCSKSLILPLAYIFHRMNLRLYGADILPGAIIGAGFQIPHPSGVVIGAGSVIGSNCKIMQGVTVGVKDVSVPAGPNDYPVIGNSVVVGTKSSILGNVVIGSKSVIGAHTLVISSFPDESKVVGIPGKQLR